MRCFAYRIAEDTDLTYFHKVWISFSCPRLLKYKLAKLAGHVVVHSLSHIWFFVAPWTPAHQPSLSFTISQSLLKLMSFESVMLSNYLILCHPLLPGLQSFPASVSFPVSWLFASGGQSIEASASASFLPVNIQGWFPLGLTGLISLMFKGFSRVFSSTTTWRHQYIGSQLSLLEKEMATHSSILEWRIPWTEEPDRL